MLEIQGKYTSAKIFTDNIEQEALSQIYSILNHPAFKEERVRICPDVHAGKGCVIGFTSTYHDAIIPNLIGVDIGCGMLTVKLGKANLKKIDYVILDDFIRKQIPHGTKAYQVDSINKNEPIKEDIKNVCSRINDLEHLDYHYCSLGTLGGGNHFIEINKDDEDNFYLVIHSGSRNFGHKVATYYQNEAIKYCSVFSKQCQYKINQYKGQNKVESDSFIDKLKELNIYNVSKELSFLQGILAQQYLDDMKIAQNFAYYNRRIMALKILNVLKVKPYCMFETVHNYISDDGIIRKGAVDANLGKELLIPINMRDGSLLCRGKGNLDWNCSAPHGAGRLMSRSEAKQVLSLDKFKETMKDVYTSSVSNATLDESPMAYKNMSEIINNIQDTVGIVKILRPCYNFKSP